MRGKHGGFRIRSSKSARTDQARPTIGSHNYHLGIHGFLTIGLMQGGLIRWSRHTHQRLKPVEVGNYTIDPVLSCVVDSALVSVIHGIIAFC